MGLRPNAVEFVFDKEFTGHGAGDILEIRRGRGEHRFQRMKQTHLHILQIAGARADGGLSDIAAQHIRQRNFSQRFFEGAGDCIFDQSFAQTDAQISREQLDQILCFQRSRAQ